MVSKCLSLSMLKSLSTAALEAKEVLYWTNSFFNARSAKELSSIFFARTADRNPSIRFAASFFGSDWLNKQPKNPSLLTGSTSLSLSLLSQLAQIVHNSTCNHVPQLSAQPEIRNGGVVWGVWGRSPQPLEANGGLGAKPPAAGGTGA